VEYNRRLKSTSCDAPLQQDYGLPTYLFTYLLTYLLTYLIYSTFAAYVHLRAALILLAAQP